MKTTKILIFLSVIFITSSCSKEKSPEPAVVTPINNSSNCNDTSLLLSIEMNNFVADNSCSAHVLKNYGATFTADRNSASNKALLFNGSSYINYPNVLGLQPAMPFTIAFWVSVDDSSDWAHNYFIQSNARPDGGYAGYLIRTSNGAIHLTVGDTTNTTRIDAQSSIPLNSNTWTHYVAVVNGNNNVKIYINGAEDSSALVTGLGTNVSYPSPSTTNGLGIIGGVHFLTNTGKLKGKMDKIKLWKKALTGTEVLSEYNNVN